ncbi:MAG: acetyl-CoA C-acyltransferase FadI [Planctomycetota bacterium]
MSSNGNGRNGQPRVAIVAGLRTPFVKQTSAFKDLSALELGTACVRELIERSGVPAEWLGQLVYGQVVPSPSAPNIAREIVLGANLPRAIEAYSVSRACATSYQSTANVADAILLGRIECGIAGGADSSSDVPITVSKPLTKALIAASKARSATDRLGCFRGLGPRDLLPTPPALTEPSTGLTMGESAEKMAKENGISRADQDALAHESHQKAARAWAEGFFDDLVMPVYVPPSYEACDRDNIFRGDSTLEGYQKLRPVFDRRYGTVTAGNSSPLTDGASALLLMREDKARAEGLKVLGTIRSYAFAALDPADQLLMGPAYATPLALDRAGVTLDELSLVDMHEAFAAQVLSNLQAFASKAWMAEKLGRSQALGEVDRDKLNVTGGSIALGHPFAATGARQIHQTLKELGRRGGGLGLVTACAAGGLGAAMVLEVAA